MNVQWKKIQLQVHLHDVTVQFFKRVTPKPITLPPVYLQLTSESDSLSSRRVCLNESPDSSGTYVACWKREVLSILITLQNSVASDLVELQPKEVKFFLKIFSKGKAEAEHLVLGYCTLDMSSLKLGSLDYAIETSEKKQLLFQFGKKATNTIEAIRLVATFQCEAMDRVEGDTSPSYRLVWLQLKYI